MSSLSSNRTGERRSRTKPTISIADAGPCDETARSSPLELELLDASDGRYIFKNVDFEIVSETGSPGRPGKTRTEYWDLPDSKL